MDALFNANAACSASSGRDALLTLVDATARRETPFARQTHDAAERLRQRRVFSSHDVSNCDNEFAPFERGKLAKQPSHVRTSHRKQSILENLGPGPSSTQPAPYQKRAAEFHNHVVATDCGKADASWQEKWSNTDTTHSRMLNDSRNSASGMGICQTKEEYSEAYGSEVMTLAYLEHVGGSVGPKYSRIMPDPNSATELNQKIDPPMDDGSGGKITLREFERLSPKSSSDLNQFVKTTIPAHLNWGLDGIVEAERAYFDAVFSDSNIPAETKWDWERLLGKSDVDQDTIPRSEIQERTNELCQVSRRRLALLYQQLSGASQEKVQ